MLIKIFLTILTYVVIIQSTHMNINSNDPDLKWLRGQLHSHANYGANQLPWTSPDVPASWYREHQYNFVSITDLNYLTPVDGLKSVFDAPGRFIIIPGVELSAEPNGLGVKILDTVGVGITPNMGFSDTSISLGGDESTVDVLRSQSFDIKSANGLPIIAHPSLTYAITAEDFITLGRQRNGPLFFEIYNGEPGMNFYGGGDKMSVEEMWDKVLSENILMYAVGTDDSHHFFEWGENKIPGQEIANPGKAWIQVLSKELTWESLSESMKRGYFYATTGLKLLSYEINGRDIKIGLDDTTRDLGWSVDGNNPQLYTTTFIGKNGKILKVDKSLTPSYRFDRHDLYVRAKIVSSDGYIAWTQPVFR